MYTTVKRLQLTLLAAVVAVCVPLSAQDTGRLSGSVIDPTGSAVPGAKVELYLAGGASPVLATSTTSEGLFSLIGIRPGFYDVAVEAPGFRKQTLRQIKIDPGRETSLPPIRLELGSVTEVVEVTATATGVQTTNAEISTAITNEQVRRLPLLNRSPLALIYSQPGVTTGRGNTVINGQRTSFANATLDGINVQDNFIRSNALDFLPNLLLLDQVAEVTIVTSNAGAMFPGGTAQVSFVTPSGTNEYHGSLYWYNRNNKLSANTWFNNRDGIPRPFLNQNQGGGTLGGPIKRDKLLFYANYEAFRLRQQSTANRTILTADARQGIFTYRDSAGNVRKANVLQLAGVGFDPVMQRLLEQVPGPEKINNFRVGDSTESLLRNTAGYSFLLRNNRTRDNVTGKLDYIHSTRHTFSGTFAWNRDIVDRPDLANDYSLVPKVRNDDAKKLLSVTWRWNPTPRFTNEVRGGFNLAPGTFLTDEKFGDYILAGMIYSNPLNTFRAQGRETNTYAQQSNASYVTGAHNFQFGFQAQQIRTAPFNDAGITPTYTIGIGTGNPGLTAAQLPGISSTDLSNANLLLASLAGYITSYSQTFNVKDRTSGFVSGATNLRHFSLDNYAWYFQDNWKLRPRLTLTLGVRYEYYTRVDERDALGLLPVVQGGSPIATLLSNSTLDFAGSAVRRPWYNRDWNNFGPNIGLAWDVFGNGRTALRAGYALGYVNDETIRSVDNNVRTNAGLSAVSTQSGLSGRVSTGLPPVIVPTFKVPRTFADNYALDTTSAFGMPDPNLRTPYVQQWNFGIQQEIKGTVIEIRYVGNKATKAFRAFDFNQVVIRENGFLEDFIRARNNAFLSLAARGTFDPRYDPSVPGSQPLTVFPLLVGGGLLTNATVQTLIRQGQAGELANVYQINRLNGPINFYRNPFALGTNMLTNYSNSSYNALQIDVRRRVRRGLLFQANYNYSKVLSDAAGDGQTRFEAFLDLNNAKIERARAPFDLTHQIKGNWVWDLPFGEGYRLNSRPLQRLISGWSISGFLTWQSGTPFSVLSERGTLNRGARSVGTNTAVTLATKRQLDDLFQLRMTGVGPFFVAASAIGPDGRAVAPDGQPPFSGQVFFHPAPGQIGTLQRRMFSGPWAFNLDFGIQKNTKITERHSLEIRMESSNIFNHPTWFVGDQLIDSTTFGRITSTFFGRRLIQFGAYYRF
ncbi:MAG: TonB-dependent receptor [Bryobacterales bacterium]|nr:TonB-dependent receptor [Bryobacteraceae bacterium]MDW8353364.1 TonB-dependent receptor [Bryobacterales bacterium]